ncbi:MAG TPA: BglII/BstYI family type II restriction endonuclease [Rhizomicrobium sp.]
MKLRIFSYRYAQEILQHPNNVVAWNEIEKILSRAPIFIYPGKSKNQKLQIVQQLMNTYFDRRFAVDAVWKYHPLATKIAKSSLAADFRKEFGSITVQAEIQFGNMARWYSDIFKFQTAYSQSLIQCGLCVVPTGEMAKAIDSNVAHYERTIRELPSANLSITLPILLVGLEQDKRTPVVDVRACQFASLKEIVGKGNSENRWRIINGYVSGADMASIGPESDTGPMLLDEIDEADTEDSD